MATVWGESLIRILIADDHIVVRLGLKQLFCLMDDVEVSGEAASGEEVLEKLRDETFDLLLLDLNMNDFSGVELITRIRAKNKKIPILIFSIHNDLILAKNALQAGANGFVNKGSMIEILMDAVRKIAGGGRFIDSSIVEHMMFEKPALHERLSERELHIFKLLAYGKGVNEIAAELAISNKTVSTHKIRLMKKMSFQSNADLVRYATEQGLIQ